MGMFDFLKKRQGAEADAPKSDELLGEEPRTWHYVLVHVTMPQDVFRLGSELKDLLLEAEGAVDFVRICLESMAMEGHDFDDRSLDEIVAEVKAYPTKFGASDGVVIELPRPAALLEAYFVAVVFGGKTRETDYLTLEAAGAGETMLCGWTEDQQHLNFGEGPEPTRSAFIKAVTDQI